MCIRDRMKRDRETNFFCVNWNKHCLLILGIEGLPPANFNRDSSVNRVPRKIDGKRCSPGKTFCADSYLGIRSTLVLPQQHVKHHRHSAKSAGDRLQPNTHAPYLCSFEWMNWHIKLVNGWLVHTERAPRRQQFHATPAIQQPNSAVSTTLLWIKGYSHSFRITCDMSAVNLLESQEQRYMKAINNNELSDVWERMS